ncbi:MAG: hypothetical protein RBT47_12575 [Anaerolineae bacterium]|nr:hypothetical protein [Anaerolineae bacterium]
MFPELNAWLDAMPDPRVLAMCTYSFRHVLWQGIATFLLRNGSRNAFDADRNSGVLPGNMLAICGETWDTERLGERRTVTCSGNTVTQLARVPTAGLARLPLLVARRLMQMRAIDGGRLFGQWWLVAIDGTLKDRGRRTRDDAPRYRYVVEAVLIVLPLGLRIPLMSEFRDMRAPVLEKEDCELNAFLRLTERLKCEFPRLPICLLLDGLYPVKAVFDRCRDYEWKLIATLREGRQPTAWNEAIEIMHASSANRQRGSRRGEDGWIEQTMRWADGVPFGDHTLQVVFLGEVGPSAATLWVWATNLMVTPERVDEIVNRGGRARQEIETHFNVGKNGGFGLEHAFCADEQASRNLHVLMQVASVLGQVLIRGMLKRLTRDCRKVTDIKLIELLRASLAFVPIPPGALPPFQLRFDNSA